MKSPTPRSMKMVEHDDQQSLASADAPNPVEDERPADLAIAPSEALAMPSWMAAKKAQRSKTMDSVQNQTGARPTRKRWIIVSAEEGEYLSPSERVIRWLRGYDAKGYLASAVIHAVLILGFVWGIWFLEALGVISFAEGGNEYVLNATLHDDESDSNQKDWFEIVDTRLDTEEGSELDAAPETMLDPRVTESETTRPILAGDLASLLSNANGQDAGNGEDARNRGYLRPKSGKAVSKGSFTAWTQPEDPAPHQSYYIIIEVKLPERVRRYKQRDLTGLVVGTDNYRQRIPPAPNNYLPIRDHVAQIAIRVPGAEAKVKDTISIQSQILNEQQILEIEF